MFTKVNSSGVDVPSPEDLNPIIVEIRGKLSEFRKERQQAFEEEQTWAAQVRENDAGRLRADRVAELLGKAPRSIPVPREERRRELKQRVVDIDRAIETLENALASEIGRANAVAVERVLPDYRKAVQSLADALMAVRRAYSSAESLQDRFASAGYSASRLTAHACHILRGDEHSDVAILEADLRKWLVRK